MTGERGDTTSCVESHVSKRKAQVMAGNFFKIAMRNTAEVVPNEELPNQ